MFLLVLLRGKDQGETKEEPRNDLRTPNHQKVLFIKIAVSVTFLIPCIVLPRELREMTEKTPTQLPANKKCYLLIFAIAISCFVLAAIPASSPPFPSSHSGTSGASAYLPPSVQFSAYMPSTPRLYTLHFTLSTIKNRTKMRFFLHFSQNFTTFAPQRSVNHRSRCSLT